jgi:ubiquinone/menaquinone biosynthesis C-methylase UbiE
MNIPDPCDATRNKCGCASQACCKSSSADSLYTSIQNGNIVCNLGTGSGFHIKTASENAGTTGKIIVIAAVPSLLSSVQKEIILYGITNAELRLGDVDSLPLESNTVDIITGENSLAANRNRDTVFSEYNRILRSDGRLVLSEIIGFCVASCLTDSSVFESLKTMLSRDLDVCLRHNGFCIESITISADKSIKYSDAAGTGSTIALSALLRASKV